MKPILFPESATAYTTEGLGKLSDAIECAVDEKRNGTYELSMIYPVTGIHYSDLSVAKQIYARPAPRKTPQPFEIYQITKPINGRVEVLAQHISYQMLSIPVMPYTATTAGAAIAGLRTYAAENCPFNFNTDIATTANFNLKEIKSMRECIGGTDGSIIDIYGGELEWDNRTVNLWRNRGEDRGVTIQYSKNLLDISHEESIEDLFTGIAPYWAGTDSDGNDILVTLPEKVIKIAEASNYRYSRTKVVDLTSKFENQPTVSELRNEANTYLANNKVTTPKISVDVDFASLAGTEEYKNVAPLEDVYLCDYVTVHAENLGIDILAKVNETKFDVLKERYLSVSLGYEKKTLSSTLSNLGKSYDTKVETLRNTYVSVSTEQSRQIDELSGQVTDVETIARSAKLVSLTDYYAVSTSNTIEPSRWETDPSRAVMTSTNKYLWYYATYLYADGSTYSTQKSVIGVYGDTGSQGPAGPAATVASRTISYAVGTSGTVAPVTGWQETVPSANPGEYVWTRSVTVFSDGTDVTMYSVAKQGETGAPGINTATVYLYQRAAATPSIPSGNFTYTFSTSTLSGNLGNWSRTILSGTDPVYMISATASSTESTDTIESTDWSTPTIAFQNGTVGRDGKMLYGTSSTLASVATKIVVCAEANDLYAGMVIRVAFAAANSSETLSLNVNNLGVKPIWANGEAVSATNQLIWPIDASVTFVYDGSHFVPMNQPGAFYGSCATIGETAAKVADVGGIIIFKGTTVNLHMIQANAVDSPTLNISNTGAKDIYAGGAAIDAEGPYNWIADSDVIFTFDGAKWVLGGSSADSKASNAQETASNAQDAANTAQETAENAQTSADNYNRTLTSSLQEVTTRTATLEQNAASFNYEFNTTIDTIVTRLGEVEDEQIKRLKTWITLDDDGISIQKVGSENDNMASRFSNDRLEFLDNGTVVSYVNGKKYYIKVGEIIDRLIFRHGENGTTAVYWAMDDKGRMVLKKGE